MPSEPDNSHNYLRGAGQLTVDAIVGVTDLVEAMHRTVTTLGGLFAGGQRERMPGVTGSVYSNIRAVTAIAGKGLDAALGVLASRLGELESSEGREALLAVLNGVVGDYLVATDNPLASPMQLRQDGKLVSVDDPALHEAIRQSGGRVLLMVHGSSCNDLQWRYKGHDHGAALADELGLVPLYLRYNSGRHTSENGSELADLLEAFVEDVPELSDLTILAHSMGGLVARSACHYAEQAGYGWRDRLRKLICLATPHHGALLERSGNWVDHILQISPYSTPFARLGKIRSCGVTDLRYGNVVHEDWRGGERFELGPDERCPVPLPDGVECYAVAATTASQSNYFIDQVVGDGLVQLDSALGRHDEPELELGFPQSHQFVARGASHLDVLCDPTVYETLEGWLETKTEPKVRPTRP